MRVAARHSVRMLVLACLCAFAPASAQTPPGDVEVAERADSYMASMTRIRGVGGSVLIARGDRILLSRGYGLADAEHAIPNNPRTIFRIASISKTFTAAAILKLQEQGRLSVEDPFCNHLPSCPAAWRPILIRQLLRHSSGIYNFTDDSFMKVGKRLPGLPIQVASRIAPKPLDFQPGERFAYSNSNYLLLGLIIEHVAREPYDAYLRRSFFEPLGLLDTQSDGPEKIVQGRARPYAWGPQGVRNADHVEMTLHQGNGGLLSTAEDLYSWSRGLRSKSLLSETSLTAMWTAGVGEYGFGWGVGRLLDRKYVGHSGQIDGFSTQLTRFPDDDATVIVLLNNEGGDASAVADDLARILFGAEHPEPVPVPEAMLEPYIGRYGVGPSKYVVTRQGEGLLLQFPDRPPDVLLADGEARFVTRVTRQGAEFTRDSAGRVRTLVLATGRGFSLIHPRSD